MDAFNSDLNNVLRYVAPSGGEARFADWRDHLVAATADVSQHPIGGSTGNYTLRKPYLNEVPVGNHGYVTTRLHMTRPDGLTSVYPTYDGTAVKGNTAPIYHKSVEGTESPGGVLTELFRNIKAGVTGGLRKLQPDTSSVHFHGNDKVSVLTEGSVMGPHTALMTRKEYESMRQDAAQSGVHFPEFVEPKSKPVQEGWERAGGK